ncbi:hypothetical protein CHS0354_006923 [Potamilus streckersoni]|uniref:ABC transmembrane type-1 domain-containing protein n=1 Tax=Potamilus streckersoni TaxID=2493646 RepID=A0AAE0WCV2_9BIVA|nr:hypothetical protein CHS0354_006923 [Potamilus streckersoni]
MPFSCPPYIIAFIYTDLLDYAGPVQKAYRSVMGISSGQPYWFPEIRSLYFAALMMAVTFYPYLYLFVRASFMQIPANVLRSAALAGYSPVGILRHIILPVSRSAVFSGLTLILMETVRDYGTVEFFNVKTFTKAVYDVWLVEGNLSGAALLALCAAVPIFAAVLYEKRARANSRYFTAKVKTASEAERQLGLLPGIAALLFCALPVLLGFIIPVLWMLYAMNAGEAENLSAMLLLALLTEYRSYSRRKISLRISSVMLCTDICTAGTILGLGILTITAGSDRIIRTVAEVLWGADIRGIIGGMLIGVIYAYSIRFFYSASGNLESAFSKINPVLEHSAKMLGYTAPMAEPLTLTDTLHSRRCSAGRSVCVRVRLQNLSVSRIFLHPDACFVAVLKPIGCPVCIFYGPPGTGKTTLAKIIANSTRSEFLMINAVLGRGQRNPQLCVQKQRISAMRGVGVRFCLWMRYTALIKPSRTHCCPM